MGAPVVASAPLGMPSHDNDAGAPHIVDRYTKGGRRLWYCLKVIQQPERARACGSGPKSSADRRPVDPPPVVELRIFEGRDWDEAQDKDITFLYNANFFLFATLEHARVMAHGRVQTPAAHTPPVLTGMPVSGMAYLDRPKEAGYFLFPDLSVRHEGRYKLTFNLYEETKEDKDLDVNAPETKPITPGLSVATGGSFDFRMEVKSQDFVVYSAKKFPGLAESTVLSRVVAEQGCRVRIRRDVRMRRRPDTKNGGDYDAGAAAEDDFRAKRNETPDARPNYSRDRSMSGSVERTPYSNDPQRRTSMADYSPQYPPQSHGPGGHLQFLGGGSNSQFPPQLPQSFPPPPPPSSVPASPVYTPSNQSSYSSQSSYPPPPPPSSTYSSEKTAPAPINPPPRRDSAQIEYRSMEYKLPPLPPVVTQSQYQSSQNLPAMKQTLPPLQNVSLPSPSVLPSPTTLSAVPRPPQSGSTLYPYSRPPAPAPVAGAKRPRDQTFRSETESRFQDGARDRGTAEDVEESQKMYYRRADGSLHDASNRD